MHTAAAIHIRINIVIDDAISCRAEHQHWKHPRKAPPLSTVVQPEAPSWGDLEIARCKSPDNDRDGNINDGCIVVANTVAKSLLRFSAAVKTIRHLWDDITIYRLSQSTNACEEIREFFEKKSWLRHKLIMNALKNILFWMKSEYKKIIFWKVLVFYIYKCARICYKHNVMKKATLDDW